MQLLIKQNTIKPSVNQKKLLKRLRRLTGQAISQYNMINEGDRIMVCLSGGKDSYAMLDLLIKLRDVAPINFELTAVNLDQKQPGFPKDVLPNYLNALDIPYHVIEEDTYSTVKRIIKDGKTTCGLCSRLRRGILYRFAEEQGFNKIALGHHKNDIIETLFLNLFFAGSLKAMPPKLLSDNGKHTVIRPLSLCSERDISKFAALANYPIIPCNLCGSQKNLQRQSIKKMLADWDLQYPGRSNIIFSAIQNIKPSQLADPLLFDFAALGSKLTRVSH